MISTHRDRIEGMSFWKNLKLHGFGYITSLLPESARLYLGMILAASLVAVNWNKDFGYFHRLTLPFLYRDYYISGVQWYLLAFSLELLILIVLVIFSRVRKKVSIFAIGYEFGSTFNLYIFYESYYGFFSQKWYGIIWDNMYYFIQMPIFFVMMFYYFDVKLSPRDIS